MSTRKPLHREALLSGLKRMLYEAVTGIPMLFMCVMQSVPPQHGTFFPDHPLSLLHRMP